MSRERGLGAVVVGDRSLKGGGVGGDEGWGGFPEAEGKGKGRWSVRSVREKKVGDGRGRSVDGNEDGRRFVSYPFFFFFLFSWRMV